MSNPTINQEYLLKLIQLFQEHGGYWRIDQSEDSNIEIEWFPFMGVSGRMVDPIFQKRVYDIKEFYEKTLAAVEVYLEY